MKTTIRYLAITFLLFVSCPLPAQADEPVKIGFILPLSGAWAEFGAAAQNGIALAREEQPAELAKIDFIFEDDHYDPKTALTAFNKLRSVDQTRAVIVFGNESALALSPVAENAQTPLLALAQLPEVSRGRHYVVRLLPSIRSFVTPTLEHLRGLGYKRFAILKAEISFFNAQVDIFKSQLRPEETLVQLDEFAPSELDFRTKIAQLKRQSFDVLGIYLVPTQVAEFYKQAADLKADFRSFGSTPFESKSVVSSSRGLMEGAVYAHYRADEAFVEKYRSKFGNDIQISYAAIAHDVSFLLARSLGGINAKTSATEIVGKLTTAPAQKGATGEFRPVFSEEEGHYLDFPVVVKRVQDTAEPSKTTNE